ncbi:hypothetical protein C7M84_016051 [Penaeus vannamei]|uniref:Uncharacterized protein n=1 Tax=Penaeus vannamei TaxID=6689 RepID=A0A3R7NT20_PENVA|nr:hypothetical protein C7M84_016051 [Penaeus vannamei]
MTDRTALVSRLTRWRVTPARWDAASPAVDLYDLLPGCQRPRGCSRRGQSESLSLLAGWCQNGGHNKPVGSDLAARRGERCAPRTCSAGNGGREVANATRAPARPRRAPGGQSARAGARTSGRAGCAGLTVPSSPWHCVRARRDLHARHRHGTYHHPRAHTTHRPIVQGSSACPRQYAATLKGSFRADLAGRSCDLT